MVAGFWRDKDGKEILWHLCENEPFPFYFCGALQSEWGVLLFFVFKVEVTLELAEGIITTEQRPSPKPMAVTHRPFVANCYPQRSLLPITTVRQALYLVIKAVGSTGAVTLPLLSALSFCWYVMPCAGWAVPQQQTRLSPGLTGQASQTLL